MDWFKRFSIDTKIQLAIMINVLLAIIISEWLIIRVFNLNDSALGIMLNIGINGTIAFLYGRFVSHAITKPLHEQVSMLKHMKSGSGDLTQRLECKSFDEVGELSSHFNEFIDHLYGIVKKTSNGIDALYASVGYFNHIGETISKGANLQQSQTRKMVNELQEMSAHEHQIARNSESAEDIAIQTEESALNGRKLINKNINGMETLNEDMKEISSALDNLKTSVETISVIVVNINEISDQTNLLALNAAIEAARAGEQGRGFAVVADEVRSLAQRAGESTTQINQIIDNIKSAVNQLSMVIDEGSSQVDKQVETSTEAGDMLNTIESCSQEAADKIKSIRKGVQVQLEIAHTVIDEISTIAEVAENNGNTVQQVVDFSNQLQEQITQLKQEVGQFKL